MQVSIRPDDGNANNDVVVPMTCCCRCGDGILQVGIEACDDGNANNDDGCTNDCAVARCGDGILRSALKPATTATQVITTPVPTIAHRHDVVMALQVGIEACDDGNANNDDGCTNDCAVARCGDGILQVGIEACDDGNANNDDGCTNDCAVARCGDGIMQVGVEACDDGNQNNDDGCTNHCRRSGVVTVYRKPNLSSVTMAMAAMRMHVSIMCAGSLRDGVILAEECDEGTRMTMMPAATTAPLHDVATASFAGVEECDDGNTADNDACRNDCTAARCGDGVIYAGVEECDDGNTADNDACRNDCTPARCGDGIIQAVSKNATTVTPMTPTHACGCVKARCDGIIYASIEGCDDGNTADNACRNDCTLHDVATVSFKRVSSATMIIPPTTCLPQYFYPARCGDGVIMQASKNATMATPPTTMPATMTPCTMWRRCRSSGCRRMRRWQYRRSDACRNDCTLHDVATDRQAGVEECDDGNTADNDACRNDCTPAQCGDGIVQAGVEECDDGNAADNVPAAMMHRRKMR